MIKSKHVITSLLAFMLALALFPFSALALTENELESAPEMDLQDETGNDAGTLASDDTGSEVSDTVDPFSGYYLPYNYSYPARGTVSVSEELDIPRLTDAELELARSLMAAEEAGEKSSFMELHYAAPEKVTEAGVYPLNPDDFDGETFYVFLPDFQMSKNQVANLISAFDELGIPFDPDSLNDKNCARGSSINRYYSSRYISPEEEIRMEKFKSDISRGIFDSEAIVPDAACKSVLVKKPGHDISHFDAFEQYCFYPYRKMTDNELAAFALIQETEWEIDPDLLEKEARQYARSLLKLPLTMAASHATRNTYGDDFIEFRNYFTLDPENCREIYASPDETPAEIMVEQFLYDHNGHEASISRVLIDFPSFYDFDQVDRQAKCSDEELIAAARQWAEKYLLIPAEDIVTDWAFMDRQEDWGTVCYLLETADWGVRLEMFESDARYGQCEIYRRSHYDDELIDESSLADAPIPSAEDIGLDVLDQSARQGASSLLKIPADLVATEARQLDDVPWFQYRSDYALNPEGDIASYGSANEIPQGFIIYQKLDEASKPCLDFMFVTYQDESGDDDQARIGDEEFIARARQWAKKYLLISESDIIADWTLDSSDAASARYRLQTREWDIYLSMLHDGQYIHCAFYSGSSD